MPLTQCAIPPHFVSICAPESTDHFENLHTVKHYHDTTACTYVSVRFDSCIQELNRLHRKSNAFVDVMSTLPTKFLLDCTFNDATSRAATRCRYSWRADRIVPDPSLRKSRTSCFWVTYLELYQFSDRLAAVSKARSTFLLIIIQ